MDPEQSEGPRAGLAEPGMLAMLREAFSIGMIGYGGPTTLDYLQKIFVSKRGWFTDAEFLDAVGWAQLLPGSTGASAMSYLGYTWPSIRPSGLPSPSSGTESPWARSRPGQC